MNDTLAIPATQTRADWRTPLELLALGAIWGGSFLFMRVAASDFGPLALVEVRIVLGALFLMPFLWRIRARIDARLWLRFAIVGALNSAIPFTLFAWGAERAPAGIGAIANSLTVLFTALVGLLVYGDRIGPRRIAADETEQFHALFGPTPPERLADAPRTDDGELDRHAANATRRPSRRAPGPTGARAAVRCGAVRVPRGTRPRCPR